jgi:serine/threonine-protein kinase
VTTRALGGRYTLGAPVGSGGSAIVYAAHDELLDRPVAAKVLRAEAAADASQVAQFRLESRIGAAIRGPGLVAVHDVGGGQDPDDPPWIVSDLVDGVSLEVSWGRSHGSTAASPLDDARAVNVVDGILVALEHVHQAGYVHRDVSPGNVLITGKGEVLLVDFGVAEAISHGPAASFPPSGDAAVAFVRGTPAYIAPEYAAGEAVDVRADVYSVGCVLYRLLLGEPPFPHAGQDDAAAHLFEPLPPIERMRPDLAPELIEVLRRSLAKHRVARFQSATEMREALSTAARLVGSQVEGSLAVSQVPDALPVAVGTTMGLPVVGPTRRLASIGGRIRLAPRPQPRRAPADGTRPAAPSAPTPQVPPGRQIGRRRRGRVRATTFGAFVTLAVVVSTLGVDRLWGTIGPAAAPPVARASTAPVPVPPVSGLRVDVATALLRVNGLGAEVSRRPDMKVAVDLCIGTTPDTGSSVTPGTVVELVVSDGPTPTTVPKLMGVGLTQARAALGIAGLALGDIVRKDGPTVADVVLSSTPATGATARVGSAVSLVLASGSNAVPAVVGLDLPSARDALHRAGFTILERHQESSRPPGTILAIGPDAGVMLRVGSGVTVLVADPPGGAAATTAVSPTAATPTGPTGIPAG